MLDYIKPIIRRKLNILLIHSGTDDLNSNGKTMKKVRDLVKCIYDLDRNEEIQLGFSSNISRQDRKPENDINETNTKLRKYCGGKEFIFVDDWNIDESCLNNRKLHVNKKGSYILSSALYIN